MAKVFFTRHEKPAAANARPAAPSGPAAAAAATVQPRDVDTFWWDSAWELRKGVDVIELTELPADILREIAMLQSPPTFRR